MPSVRFAIHRAERFPSVVKLQMEGVPGEVRYVRERMCNEAMIDSFFRGCSECDYMWEFMYGIGRCERPSFCPNCGAKVIEL